MEHQGDGSYPFHLRGPLRSIVSVRDGPAPTNEWAKEITLSCGHTSFFVPIFEYVPGDYVRCKRCTAALPPTDHD